MFYQRRRRYGAPDGIATKRHKGHKVPMSCPFLCLLCLFVANSAGQRRRAAIRSPFGLTMRYQIQQRMWTITARYDVANEAGEPILEAIREFSFWPRISIRTKSGAELALLRQKVLSWRPRFDITRDGRPLTIVQRRWTLRPYYTVELPEGGLLEVTGSFWEHTYQFKEGERLVAAVSHPMWTLRDMYGVEVFDPHYDAVVLATVIAIDALRAQSEQSS